MKSRNILLNTVMLFTLFTGTAMAGPQNGFGLNAGLALHNMSYPGSSYSSSGLSIGLDYQFAVSENLSINPFLMSSGESTDVSLVTANHGILGVQLRYWADGMFFGGHLGGYSEELTASIGTFSTSTSGSGGGAGLVAGWENPDGGLYVMGQLDSATIKYSGVADRKLSAFRFSLGYRWK